MRRAAVAAAALCLTAAAAAPAGPAGGASRGDRDRDRWTSEAASRYWTPARMASAVPLVPEPGEPRSRSAPSGTSRTVRASRTSRTSRTSAAGLRSGTAVTAQHFDGVPSVGVLFSTTKDARAHYCTASVVHSRRGNLIITAGHCRPGGRAAFVPQYRSGARHQPYGIWAIDRGFTHPGRADSGAGSDLDFAFATVRRDLLGRSVEALTGGNVLTRTPGYRVLVTVIGYPTPRHDPADRAVRCTTRTSRLAGHRQLRMVCGGFHGGTSGGPWLTAFDEKTKTGKVIGNIGGLNRGGPSGRDSHRISYSPVYGDEVFKLYARAVAG
ncbi:trypsin-like serine protease [Streptomyces sp. MST-110588]|uniref:trypsin-like serine peptidase n=1 Tax=Streptomyces sp. MST-110588 TaxID=2833628 RepID=UPI001F5C7BD2|nr:trypsin-like serine protease [Streptomyces sp. MST-110588]